MRDTSTLHPVHQCNDGLFNAASGKKISLDKPTREMIDIEDIAAGLSKICRFGGQLAGDLFYSVAQHSVLVAAMAPPELKREALLHDATEAYLGDVIKPLKNKLGEEYRIMEHKFNRAIDLHFGTRLDDGEIYLQIKHFDHKALELEDQALRYGKLGPLIEALEANTLLLPDQWAWDHKLSRKFFMIAYNEYFNL